MKLAVVTGQIVCTVRHHGLAHDKLLMVEMIDPQGNPDGQCAVAIDEIRTRWPDYTIDESRCERVQMSNVAGYSSVPFATS